jgi:uncharacterized protein YndB with AHSA1/START domain
VSDRAPPGGAVRVVHVFDAPREAVFAAWTDPEQVARWWAPEQFEIPLESVDIEPSVGGRFHLTMVETNGSRRFPYRSTIIEISEPELIVLSSEAIPEAGIAATVTRVVFEAEGERTRMTVTSGPYTDEMRGSAEAGWYDLVANLERLLATATS